MLIEWDLDRAKRFLNENLCHSFYEKEKTKECIRFLITEIEKKKDEIEILKEEKENEIEILKEDLEREIRDLKREIRDLVREINELKFTIESQQDLLLKNNKLKTF